MLMDPSIQMAASVLSSYKLIDTLQRNEDGSRSVDIVEHIESKKRIIDKHALIEYSSEKTIECLYELDIYLTLLIGSTEPTWRSNPPPIVGLKGYELEGDRLHLLLEHCSRGDLFNEIKQKNSPLSQTRIQSVMREFLCGLQFLHDMGIAHLDLSLENIFVKDDYSIRIGDFEHALRFTTDVNGKSRKRKIRGIAKDPYAAPELFVAAALNFNKRVDVTKVDTYAAGVILWILCTNTMYSHPSNPDIWAMWQHHYQFSPLLCDLLKRLLNPHPSARASVAEALNHPWITSSLVVKQLNLTEKKSVRFESDLDVRKMEQKTQNSTLQPKPSIIRRVINKCKALKLWNTVQPYTS